MTLVLEELNRTWAAVATREELLAAMTRASVVQRQVDAALTVCRSELARRRPEGSGASASDEAATKRATGCSKAEARRQEQRSEVALSVPLLGDALGDGKVSGAHLDAVADVVPDNMIEALANNRDVLQSALDTGPDAFRRSVRDFVADEERARGIDRAARQRDRRGAAILKNLRSGMIELSGAWEPAVGSAIRSVLRTEYRRLLSADQKPDHPEHFGGRTPRQRMADAMANVIRGGASRAQSPDDALPVVVIERPALDGTDPEARCEVEGEPISVETARRFTCDSNVDLLTLDHLGKPVSLNTLKRHANSKQRRALEAIYGGCGVEACGVTVGDCHIHHIIPWELKNESSLIDLIPLCSRHHHMIHEGGWTLARSPDWVDRWASPDGEVHERRPVLPPSLAARAA
jgi:hypothetical protein